MKTTVNFLLFLKLVSGMSLPQEALKSTGRRLLAHSDTCSDPAAGSAAWREQFELFYRFAPRGEPPGIYVANSSVHGRGVFTSVPLKKGDRVSLLWFEYKAGAPIKVEPSGGAQVPGSDFAYREGFLPAGQVTHFQGEIDPDPGTLTDLYRASLMEFLCIM